MKTTIIKKISINADASKVWDVLTNPKITKMYMFDCLAISNWTKGSPLIWKGRKDNKVYVKGTVKEIIPNKVLSFTTFDPNSGLKDEPLNYLTATYHLHSQNGKTTLEVTYGDFSNVEKMVKQDFTNQKKAGIWCFRK